ncbi:MAG: tetratricopeptide repeat protein [Planctomycetota bacterium]
MRTRRWTLVIVVVLLMGILATAVILYLSRQSADTLLARAEVALRADQIDKALDYTQQYIAQNPEDWKGHFEQARVFMHAGRYEDARKQLDQARTRGGDPGRIGLLSGRSWSRAGRMLLQAAGDPNVAELRTAIDNFAEANKVLEPLAGKNGSASPAAREMQGECLYDLAKANEELAGGLRRQASVARAARKDALGADLEEQADQATARAEESYAQGRDLFLSLVKEDPSRSSAAESLTRLCIAAEDHSTLSKLDELFDQPDHPAAEAEVVLWTWRLGRLDPTNPTDRQELTQAARRMDAILADRPDVKTARLLRARLAIRLDDAATARKQNEVLLAANSEDREAMLIEAQLLRMDGDLAQAERKLFSLKTRHPRWLAAQMIYARVASEAGYPDLARQALREAVRIAPDYPDARRRLALYLLAEGYYEEAYAEARAYHRVAPDEPEAVRLYAVTSARAGFEDRARRHLDEAKTKFADQPDVLITIAEAYGEIGAGASARRLAMTVADAKGDSSSARLAVARALMLTGRLKDARDLLEQEREKHPSQPEVLVQLAEIHAARGRILDALELYRLASNVAPNRPRYAIKLARALMDQGELEEALRVLDSLPADHSQASLLRLQLQLRRGVPMETDHLIAQVQEGRRRGLPLALIHLRNGQPAKCAEICLAELQKHPEDIGTLTLLGQAYLAMDQTDACIKQWKKVLELGPERLRVYLKLGEVLARTMETDQVARELSRVPGSVENLVHMTAAALFARDGKHGRAASRYGRVAGNDKAPDYLRGRAGLLRVHALARAEQYDLAVRQLDEVEKMPVWQTQAILARAQLMYSAGRRKAGAEQLQRVLKLARDANDIPALRRLIGVSLAVRETGVALQAAEEAARLAPKEPRSHMDIARVHLAARRGEDVEAACRDAIAVEPGNIRAQLMLTEVLELQGKRAEALHVLQAMEKQGKANQSVSLLHQGKLLRRWGLAEPAMERYVRLQELGYDKSPRVQLALGMTYFRLGHREKASETLQGIPEHATEYVRARQILAEMAETPEQKLAALKTLAEKNPDQPTIAIQQMSVLLQSSRNEEAATAFRTLLDDPDQESISTSAAMQAVRAMIRKNQVSQAVETCMKLDKRSHRPGWRYLAILLTMADKPQVASQMLQQPETPSEVDMLLGIAKAGLTGDTDDARMWWTRFRATRPENVSSVSRVVILAALVGDPNEGVKLVSEHKAFSAHWAWAVAELADAVRKGTAGPGEAARLLRAEIALKLAVPEAARAWSVEVLKARPTCQWPVAMEVDASELAKPRSEVAETIRPKDAPIARMLRASRLAWDRKFAEAQEAYAKLAEAYPDKQDLGMLHASAAETAGKLDDALALYEKVYEEFKHPMAANNAAYLIAVLHADDAKKLDRAWTLADAAMRRFPGSAACHDTTGWLAYLRGEYPLARRHLLQAVRRAPQTPEIHYHLGMAEHTGGSKKLGRWHLQAAVDVGNRLKKADTPLSSETLRVLALAEKALR